MYKYQAVPLGITTDSVLGKRLGNVIENEKWLVITLAIFNNVAFFAFFLGGSPEFYRLIGLASSRLYIGTVCLLVLALGDKDEEWWALKLDKLEQGLKARVTAWVSERSMSVWIVRLGIPILFLSLWLFYLTFNKYAAAPLGVEIT
ncbi:MAG: hypothetical protein ACO2Y2_02070 [Poseidonia sp.]